MTKSKMSGLKTMLSKKNTLQKKLAIAKASKYLVVVLAVAAIALAGLTIAAITVNQSIPSSGTITTGPNVGVYSDSACTNSLTSINWGSVEAGSSASQTIYIEDTGGSPMTLNLSVGNWSPSTASNYVTLTWTGQGATIQPGVGGALAVTLTLTVSSSTPTSITSFSNSITVSGTG